MEECGRGSVGGGGGSLDTSLELETSAVGARHVHFAPELGGVLAALDEAGAAGFLQHQRDLSADIKRELEHSLRRLRHEAHDLLDLSVRLAANSTYKLQRATPADNPGLEGREQPDDIKGASEITSCFILLFRKESGNKNVGIESSGNKRARR